MKVKKLLATVLALALLASFASAFALTTSAEDVTVIPQVKVHPTLDGVITPGEWDGAYTETLDYESAKIKYSKVVGSGSLADEMPTASVKISMVWYIGPTDEYGDWYPQEDTEAGIYYLFEVVDTTRPWYVGYGGGSPEAPATDCVQVFLDPGNFKSSYPHESSYCYTFVPASPGGPGVGTVPSGAGFWWECWSYQGGEVTSAGVYKDFAEIASTPDFTFDPAYPLPEGDPEDPGYDQALNNAYMEATQNGYMIEGFISFFGMSYMSGDGDEEMFLVNSPDTAVGTQFGMGIGLVDYLYDGPQNPVGDEIRDNQHIVACMANCGFYEWQDVDYPDSYRTYELGPMAPDATITLASNVAEVGKEITATVTLDTSKVDIGGMILDLTYDKEALELVSTEDDILASVGFEGYEQDGKEAITVNTDYEGKGIRLVGVNLEGIKAPCQIMKVKFKVLKEIEGEFPALVLTATEVADTAEEPALISVKVDTKLVTVLKGDINNDTKINISDAFLAFKYVAGKESLDDTAIEAGDVIGNDGKLAIADAMQIFRYVAGKISEF